jgi:hypothetical protein
VKFTPAGGRVEVGLGRTDSHQVTVRLGIGIGAAILLASSTDSSG